MLSPVGALCLPAYLLGSLWIGWWSRPRRQSSAGSFLNANASLPLPLVTIAFLAANCGALEVVGLSALAAQYGALAFHFYWIGAIPAMICLGLYVMPVYRASGVGSVPRYLGVRFGSRLASLNAIAVALAMLMLSGISLYAMAEVLQVMLGLPFAAGVLSSAMVVLAYVLLGGIRATIYTEVFQLAVMVCGLLPLAVRSGWLLHKAGPLPRGMGHAWAGLPIVQAHAPVDRVSLVLGLGLILSFGYWCTDFVLMQRAFAARTELQARAVPLWAGFGKLVFGFIVVLPGLAASHLPLATQWHRYDQSLPAMMSSLYGPTMLGLGLTALAASLMSGLAANVAGFSAVCTEDLYRQHWRPGRPERHYLRVGRAASTAAVFAGVCCSVVSFRFGNLMEHIQLIFALLNAPFWAVFLLGVGSRRVTESAACAGLLSGVLTGAVHQVLLLHGTLRYGSRLSSTFYSAIFSFTSAMLVSCLWTLAQGTTAAAMPPWPVRLTLQSGAIWLWVLAALLIVCCVALNRFWW